MIIYNIVIHVDTDITKILSMTKMRKEFQSYWWQERVEKNHYFILVGR